MFIYGLHHPETNELRYIGQTVVALRARLRNHVWSAKNVSEPRHVLSWIKVRNPIARLTDGQV